MRQEFFGMRRANGDWFVLDVSGQTRVLVFRDLAVAWRARATNVELMLFWPTPIDEKMLSEFATADQGRPASFWLIDDEDPAADLQKGHPLEYMQIASLERLTDLPLKPIEKARGHAAGGRAWPS
jgi:hypothetical protein